MKIDADVTVIGDACQLGNAAMTFAVTIAHIISAPHYLIWSSTFMTAEELEPYVDHLQPLRKCENERNLRNALEICLNRKA